MGKAERNRQQNARQRIALQQAAAKRAETQRRAFIAGGSILLVIVIVVGLVVAKSLGGNSTTPTSTASTAAKTESTVATQVTTVPQAVLNKDGAGPSGSTAVAPLKTITSPALTSDNKPEMLYIGAEYCPYCAAERWAMAVALSRFGTLSNLHFIHSTSTDVFASTPTLTFYQSSYTSKYLSFVPLETETVGEKALQKPTAAESALIAKYGQNSFPFVDIDGKYIISGAQYLPSTLGSSSDTGVVSKNILTWQQVGNDLQDPSSPVGQAIIGSANHIIAAICQVTHNQPSNVCSAPNVTAVSGNI
jgi:thiol-disulfide isomerase/thioredoxin